MKHLLKTTLLLLALLLPALANAHDFEVDGIYYNINGNEATVTYKGTSGTDYSNEYSGSIVIPTTVTNNGVTYSVTSIGEGAFFGCSGLTSIDIPNSVISIGYEAFQVTAWYSNQPDGLVYAGLVAYEYKGSMPNGTSITLKEGTLGIADRAFSGCSGLTSINIPNSVISIGSGAFNGCSGLTSINIPNSVTSIGNKAFQGTAWYNSQPDGLVYAGLVAYKYKGTMPNGTSITLKEGTLGIAGETFYECSGLTSINLGNSVTSIGDYAFYKCTGLTSIDIPNSVTSISNWTFYGCTGLTSIHIPNSLTSIGDWAFDECTGLTSINIPNSVTSIGDHVFLNCTGLTSIDIPNSVTSIGDGAFYGCSGLTSINIPNSVTSIGGCAFSGCTGLTSINIPNSVISIGNQAFQGTAWYNSQPDGLVYAGLVAYKYKGTMPNGTSITLKEGTLGIADCAFIRCAGLTSIEIPNSVIPIGDNAFSYCNGLTSINIPNSVTSIGDYAFSYCSGLTSINIPNSVTSIGERAFDECSGLTRIDIPNSVTSIGKFAFFRCSGLTSINIGNSVTTINGSTFYSCPNVTSINCFAVNPPACIAYVDWSSEYVWSVFNNYSATLHVPNTSLAAYFTTPEWSNFENIVGDAVAPNGISISMDSVEIQLGELFELTATVAPANASIKEVTWYSTDKTVATVEDGVVTPIGYGECDIVAMCFGMQAVCHVTVANRIMLDQHDVMLQPNHILTLTPTAPVMPNQFIVTSSDATVAAARVMNGKVQIVGVAEGKTTITIGSANGLAVPATCLVTVYTEKGDVNMDGFVNISDVTRTISYVLSGNDSGFKFANADLNGDGRVNVSDVTALISRVLTTTE